jgi:transposase
MPGRLALPFTKLELSAALAKEMRVRVRKRLAALRAVLRADSIEEAARLARAPHSSMARWVTRAQAGGLAAVLTDLPRRPPPMTPEFVAAVRADIASALRRPLRRRLKSRLQGIDAALAGEPLENAAAIAGLGQATLQKWLVQVREFGITALLAYWMPFHADHLKVNADASELRAHAMREPNPRKRKRLIALACMAEGLSLNDAAVESGISDRTITTTVLRFQQGGLGAICPRKHRPTGRRPRLGPKELEMVAAMIRATPQSITEQLCAEIESRFGIRYTLSGLKNMLKKQWHRV